MGTRSVVARVAISALAAVAAVAGCGGPSTRAASSSSPATVGPPASPSVSQRVPSRPTPTKGAGALSVTPAHPCLGAAPPATYQHVIWIVMENKPAGASVGSNSAPRLTALAAQCGRASSYHAVSHPSLPNYLAMTSGSTHGVSDDADPSSHPIAGGSIFSEVTASGGSWATYAESMPGNCVRYPVSPYAVKHNPAAYYTGLGGSCASHDVPSGSTGSGPLASALRSGRLPSFSFVVPNLCDDTHDCSVSTGDGWLGRWLAVITSSPVYAQGRTAVFVTWDEDDSSHGNAVDLVTVAPSVRPGTRASGAFTHLSLLRTTELMLGVRGSLAPGAASMRGAFHL